MKRIAASILLAFLIFGNGFAQEIPTETERYLYWQKDVHLELENFKGVVGDCGSEVVDSIEVGASACIGVWSILDVPKKWKKGQEYEKFYFSPVFDKSKSWALSADSVEILKQQVYFDLSEISARWARKELYKLREQAGNATGSTAIYYSTVVEQMNDLRLGMYGAYFDAVFRTNSMDSLSSWVNFTQEMLLQNQEFATKPEEFQRLLSGKPEKGYKQAERIVAPIQAKDD